MPKIIENLREQLLSETKRQIKERGYANTTIRSVAGACGVGVGTVYNYFESKEMLVASFLFEDWKCHLLEMSLLPYEDPARLLRGIYDSLRRFASENEKLFSDTDVTRLVSTSSAPRHKMLREQIASFILPLCLAEQVEDPEFTAAFLSESIISWSMENADFEKIYPILEKTIKN